MRGSTGVRWPMYESAPDLGRAEELQISLKELDLACCEDGGRGVVG
jgi:hypothetical protein